MGLIENIIQKKNKKKDIMANEISRKKMKNSLSSRG
jgi:hypothetical protein